MLQRIQTVYLLIIVVLTTLLWFFPLATLQAEGQFYRFDVSGLTTMVDKELIYPTWGLFALTVVIAFVALVTIFLYKRRMLQIRLCIFNGLLMIGFYGLFGFILWNLKTDMDASIMGKITIAFPLVSMVLDYLAIRNIGADEALVRSLQRLR